jgi:hypothetical protein
MKRLALVLLIGAAGCAGPAVDAQWTDPQLSGHPLRGGRVYVVCEAAEAVIARLCQERMQAELQARGAATVAAPDSVAQSPQAPRDDARYVALARAAGTQSVWVASITPETAPAEPRSGLSIGLGGFRVGSHGGVGAGVSLPIGGGGASPPLYAASARVTDVASGRLLWTARAGGASADAQAQIDALLPRLVDAAGRLF